MHIIIYQILHIQYMHRNARAETWCHVYTLCQYSYCYYVNHTLEGNMELLEPYSVKKKAAH